MFPCGVIVADGLAVSPIQSEEHKLELQFVIKDPIGKIVFVGYKTNPLKKCIADKYRSLECDYLKKR